MKQIKPAFKCLIYQNSEFGPQTVDSQAVINAHPEWWIKDDAGNPIMHAQKTYILNHSRADVRSWYNNYPIQVFGKRAKELLDGIFNDGMGYSPEEFGPACNATTCWPKVNRARNDAAFAGKMLLGDEARTLYGNLNGGEVWGNAALGVTARYNNFTYKDQLVSWQTVMDHVDTGFLEGALGMWYVLALHGGPPLHKGHSHGARTT